MYFAWLLDRYFYILILATSFHCILAEGGYFVPYRLLSRSSFSGPLEEQISKESDPNIHHNNEHVSFQVQGGRGKSHNHQHDHVVDVCELFFCLSCFRFMYDTFCSQLQAKFQDVPSASQKSRVKKKGSQGVSSFAVPEPSEQAGKYSLFMITDKSDILVPFDNHLTRGVWGISVRCDSWTIL